jgi:hypothetical protein
MPVLLLKAAPLYAYTARALGAGRYPLQSGLCTSEQIIALAPITGPLLNR